MGYSAPLFALAQKLNQELPLQFPVRPSNTLVVKEDEDIFDLNEEVEVVEVMSGLCNHPDITSCDWDVCSKLKELHIGDGCLENVMSFVLKDLVKLERVEIRCSCFTKAKGRMEVSGCGLLKSVKIGRDSFEKWSGFVMRDCGVEEVEIGDGCFMFCENTVFEGGNME